jgi:PBP1b-binding outer membrane lipoprotein LpoB
VYDNHDDVEQSDSEQINTASTSNDQCDQTSSSSTYTEHNNIASTSFESSQSIPHQKHLKRTYIKKTIKDKPLHRDRKEMITQSICEIITSNLLLFSVSCF